MINYIAKHICDSCGELTVVPNFVILMLIHNKKVPSVCYACGDVRLITNELVWEKEITKDNEIES